MKATRFVVLFALLGILALVPILAAADCPPSYPNCQLEPPQSIEINPHPVRADGSPIELPDAGIYQPIQIQGPMPFPARVDPSDSMPSGSGAERPGDMPFVETRGSAFLHNAGGDSAAGPEGDGPGSSDASGRSSSPAGAAAPLLAAALAAAAGILSTASTMAGGGTLSRMFVPGGDRRENAPAAPPLIQVSASGLGASALPQATWIPGGSSSGAPAGYRAVERTVVERIARMISVQVQEGFKPLVERVPRMVSRLVQDGWRAVVDRVPRIITRTVQRGWKTVVDTGRKIFEYGTRLVQRGWNTVVDTGRRIYEYGKRIVQRGWKTVSNWAKGIWGWFKKTFRIPNYVEERIVTGWRYATRTVPNMVRETFVKGWCFATKTIPHMVSEVVQDGWNFITKTVPNYVTKLVQDGWEFVSQTVPNYVTKLVQDGWETVTRKVVEYVPVAVAAAAPARPPEPVLVPVPGFTSDPLGWLQATLINAGRENETIRGLLTGALAPAAERLNRVREFREDLTDYLRRSLAGWKQAGEGYAALVSYAWQAASEGRWEDVRRALMALKQVEPDLLDAVLKQYDDLPFLVQVGVGVAPGGDVVDLVREGRKATKGEGIDGMVVLLSLFGLALDLGWADGLIPDPVDGANAAVSFLKNLLKQLPNGPAREAVEFMIKNPDDWGRIAETAQALLTKLDELKWVDDPEVLVWLLQRGPDTVANFAKYGEDALRAAERLVEVGRHSDESAELIDTILRAAKHGSGERLFIGKYVKPGEGIGYLQAGAREGIVYDLPPTVRDLFRSNDDLAWAVNERFLQTQLENGVARIDFIGETVQQARTAVGTFRWREIDFLDSFAESYGYILVENSWIKVR